MFFRPTQPIIPEPPTLPRPSAAEAARIAVHEALKRAQQRTDELTARKEEIERELRELAPILTALQAAQSSIDPDIPLSPSELQVLP